MSGRGGHVQRRAVSLLVSYQVAPIGKAFAAELALERLLPCVDRHVPLDRRLLRELLVADLTAKRLLARVRPHMDLDALLIRKALRTHRTGEGPFARV